MVEWVHFNFKLYAYSILYNMAVMWWCSILGPCRILLLLITCFITFYIRKGLQQKQHQCIIYCMHCRSLLREIVEKFESEIKFEMYADRIWILKPNFENSNIPNQYNKFYKPVYNVEVVQIYWESRGLCWPAYCRQSSANIQHIKFMHADQLSHDDSIWPQTDNEINSKNIIRNQKNILQTTVISNWSLLYTISWKWF